MHTSTQRLNHPLVRTVQVVVLIASVAMFALFSTPAHAGAWSRATGEAKELQRTTKDLRNRLSRLFPHASVTRCAITMDEVANQMIESTRVNTPEFVFDAQLQQFAAAYEHTRLQVASDYQLSSDRNVSRYVSEIGRRFEYLIKDLQRATPPAVIHPRPGVFPVPQGQNYELRYQPLVPAPVRRPPPTMVPGVVRPPQPIPAQPPIRLEINLPRISL